MCVCTCVRACVRVRACVCACVRAGCFPPDARLPCPRSESGLECLGLGRCVEVRGHECMKGRLGVWDCVSVCVCVCVSV